MSILSLEDVAVSFGASDILEGVTCEAQPGDRIGLVGRNGAGKTTLLRVLAGVEAPSRGRRRLQRGASVTLVEQIPPQALRPSQARPSSPLSEVGEGQGVRSVRAEALTAMRDVLELAAEMEQAAHDLASGDADAAHRYAELLERMEHQGAFTYESQLEGVLLGLGLREEDWDAPVASLSGGQRNRLALAKALLAAPDVILMDEPTNHLDLRGLQWLEGFLNRWPGTVIVTSHDRYFLDAIATKIWFLDPLAPRERANSSSSLSPSGERERVRGARLKAYPGNYTKFEELRQADAVRLEKEYRAQQELIAKEEAFIRRYGAGQRAREAKGREKRLNRLERIEAPTSSKTTSLRFDASRSGDLVLATKQLVAGYNGVPILDVPDLELVRGDRIALIGPNGSGKSTLLKTIAGELAPVDGSLRIGAAVSVGHYWQEAENLDPSLSVLDDLLREGGLRLQEARNMLGRFLFSGDDVDKRVSMLSGGERSRLALAKLVLSQGNLLLLDEPTNHLDIPSREALEDALDAYTGSLIFASHDRRLIARIATKLWVLEDGELRQFEGSLEEYDTSPPAPLSPSSPSGQAFDRAQDRPAGKGEHAPVPASKVEANPSSRKPDLPSPASTSGSPSPRKERGLGGEVNNNRARELQARIAALEAAIDEQEQALVDIGALINAASDHGDVEAVAELGRRYEAAQSELDRLLSEWTELAE